MLSPTPEQEAILDFASSETGNLQIVSYAGTGKTTTLELLQRHIGGPILCLAFNKAVAVEMEERFESTTAVRTFNGLGHRVWGEVCANRLVLNTKKTQDLLAEEIKKLKGDDKAQAQEAFFEIIQAVGLAKSLGYVPGGNGLVSRDEFIASLEDRPSVLVESIINTVLKTSITRAYAGLIDFADQIYMPAVFGGTFPKFPLVLVDEAQDLSNTNHRMLEKMAKSRFITVGDPFQSIYQFRGACQGGMARLAGIFSMKELRLSVSWRCPEEIVKNARWRVPDFKWSKAGGKVTVLSSLALGELPETCAIICRNNAPLIRLAFTLLGNGRACRLAGTDIGPRIVNILKRFGESAMPRMAVLSKIAQWRAKKDEDNRSADDMAACLRIFAEKGKDLGQAIMYAEDIIKKKGSITLTTGHKAKGLEWDTVYHLSPHLLGYSEQDLNLKYVIQTRAKEAYYEIDEGCIEEGA